MLIDWFTVGAQVVNFLILVWLLRHFLYRPILRAIDTREKRLAAEQADAAAKKAEAEKEQGDFQRKNQTFDAQRGALFAQATAEAKAERGRLFDQARQEADAALAQQEEAAGRERQSRGQEITRRAQEEVFGVIRQALGELATASLEERLGEIFTRRLRALDGPAKESLGAALRASNEPALVRSTFELPAEQKAAIQNALSETFAADIRLRFETGPDAICGIELTVQGQRIGWSIAGYLAALQEKVAALDDLRSPAAAPVTP